MERDEMLKEILSDPLLKENHKVRDMDLPKMKATPPYVNKAQEIMSIVINEEANHLNSNMIYKKIKKAHGI